MTLLFDLVSHHFEQHLPKSNDCTYLSLLFLMACLFNAPNLIYLFIGNQIFFITLLTCFQPSSLLSSYHLPICWETTFLDLILMGTESSLIALWLEADDGVILQINSSYWLREPPCGWWKYDLLDAMNTVPWC